MAKPRKFERYGTIIGEVNTIQLKRLKEREEKKAATKLRREQRKLNRANNPLVECRREELKRERYERRNDSRREKRAALLPKDRKCKFCGEIKLKPKEWFVRNVVCCRSCAILLKL